MSAVGLEPGERHPELPPQIVSTGLAHAIAPLADADSLARTEPDYPATTSCWRPTARWSCTSPGVRPGEAGPAATRASSSWGRIPRPARPSAPSARTSPSARARPRSRSARARRWGARACSRPREGELVLRQRRRDPADPGDRGLALNDDVGDTARHADCDAIVAGAALGLAAARSWSGRAWTCGCWRRATASAGAHLNHPWRCPEDVVELAGSGSVPYSSRRWRWRARAGAGDVTAKGRGWRVRGTWPGLSRYTGAIPRILAPAEDFAAPTRVHGHGRVDPQPWRRRRPRSSTKTFETWTRRSAKTRTAREALALGIRAARPELADLASRTPLLRGQRMAATSCWRWKGPASRPVVGGSQRISLGMADELGEQVQLETLVRSIRVDGEAVIVGELRARRAIGGRRRCGTPGLRAGDARPARPADPAGADGPR